MIGINSTIEQITLNGKQIWQGCFWIAQTKMCVIGNDHVEVRDYIDELIREFYLIDIKTERPDISNKDYFDEAKLIIRVMGRDIKKTEEIFNWQLKRLKELTE